MSKAAAEPLGDPSASLIIPSIVLAEVWYLYHRNRIATKPEQIRDRILSASNCSVYPLDEAVLELLPVGFELHDAIIVATACLYADVLDQAVQLITCDRTIAAAGLVETLW